MLALERRPRPRRRLSGRAESVSDTLKKNIAERFPDAKVEAINASPIAGLYEVFLGDTIVYADPAGDYLILGSMMDSKTRTNLTTERMNALNSILRAAAAGEGHQGGEGQRQDVSSPCSGSRLPVLPSAGKHDRGHDGRHGLYVPVSDREPASGCAQQGAQHLVRQRSQRRVDDLDAAEEAGAGCSSELQGRSCEGVAGHRGQVPCEQHAYAVLPEREAASVGALQQKQLEAYLDAPAAKAGTPKS